MKQKMKEGIMSNQNLQLESLIEEYANVAEGAAHAYENGEDYSSFEPWLQTCVDAILALKNAN